MDDKTYHKQILKELDDELDHQKQFLKSLKEWVGNCQAKGLSSLNPLQILMEEAEIRKTSIEKAIAEIKKQTK